MQWSMRLSALCIALGAFAPTGCAERGETASGVTDTNTNWLKSCENDTTCGGLNCLCGVCTVTCEQEQECARFSSEAECAKQTEGQCSVSAVCTLRPADSSEPQSTCTECDASTRDPSSTTSESASARGTTTASDITLTSTDEPLDASTSETTKSDATNASTNVFSSEATTSVMNSDAGDSSTDDGCGLSDEGGVCRGEGSVCGELCTDACQFCNRLVCTGGVWQRQEVFPAPCSSCGPDLNCNTLDNYCRIEAGTTYSCEPYPTECTSDHSCECVESQLDGVCTTDGTGVTLATGVTQLTQCDCTVWYTESTWCGQDAGSTQIEWVCVAQGELLESLNAECIVLPTDAPRWCCPTTFAPACN